MVTLKWSSTSNPKLEEITGGGALFVGRSKAVLEWVFSKDPTYINIALADAAEFNLLELVKYLESLGGNDWDGAINAVESSQRGLEMLEYAISKKLGR